MRILVTTLLLLAAAVTSLPAANAQPVPAVRYQCSSGMESSFCVLTVGPCHETTGSSHSGEVDDSWHSAGCTLLVVGPCGASTDSRDDVAVNCGPI